MYDVLDEEREDSDESESKKPEPAAVHATKIAPVAPKRRKKIQVSTALPQVSANYAPAPSKDKKSSKKEKASTPKVPTPLR